MRFERSANCFRPVRVNKVSGRSSSSPYTHKVTSMDSPFLPRLPRADDTDDGTLVLADLSLLPDDEDDSPLAHTVPLPRASAPPPLTAKSHLRGPSTSASASQSQSQSLAGSQPSRLFSSQRSDTAADDLHGSGSGASGEQQPESGDEGPSDKHEADLRATLAQLRQLNNVMDGCLHAIEVTSERNKVSRGGRPGVDVNHEPSSADMPVVVRAGWLYSSPAERIHISTWANSAYQGAVVEYQVDRPA